MPPTPLVALAAALATAADLTNRIATGTGTPAGNSEAIVLPPQFVALGVSAAVVVTIAWFFLEKAGRGRFR